uniref:Uncharacterized protein n=1 Tax=Strigamia maritima TaxID=126957 RepID=T1IHN0_STRMM
MQRKGSGQLGEGQFGEDNSANRSLSILNKSGAPGFEVEITYVAIIIENTGQMFTMQMLTLSVCRHGLSPGSLGGRTPPNRIHMVCRSFAVDKDI